MNDMIPDSIFLFIGYVHLLLKIVYHEKTVVSYNKYTNVTRNLIRLLCAVLYATHMYLNEVVAANTLQLVILKTTRN